MRRNMKTLLAVVMSIVMLLGVGTMVALATPVNPTLPGGARPLPDPTQNVTLNVHHTITQTGVTPGDVTGTAPTPQGSPVVGANWYAVRVTVPGNVDPSAFTLAQLRAMRDAEMTAGNYTATTTNASGLATWSFGTNHGIYLVWEGISNVTSLSERHEPFLVNLPMFYTPAPEWDENEEEYVYSDGDWLYTVNVFTKQDTEDPDFTKELGTVDGHTVTWHIDIQITEGLATLLPVPAAQLAPTSAVPVFIRVTDTLDSRLTFNSTATRVIVIDDNDDEHVITGWTAAVGAVPAANTVVIDFPAAARDAAVAVTDGETIRIELVTTLADNADQSMGTIYNEATMQFGPNPPDDTDPDPVDRFGLEIRKNNTDGTMLPGAVFELLSQDGTVIRNNLTTGTDGTVRIYGLTAGVYTLREISAPTGYNSIVGDMVLTINRSTAAGPFPAYPEVPQPAAFLVSVTITNTADFDLPLTGGAGTLIFTIVGLTLIGGSILFLVVFKKRQREEETY